MRILLHIGTHKTGTTSIQKFCARNRERLRAGGLWYPDYDLIGAEGHYAHHHLANAIAGLPTSRGVLADAERYFAAVRRQAGVDETVLISAESFWRHVSPPVELSKNEVQAAGGLGPYWAGRRAFVARVAEMAGAEGVEIAVVLRRQDDCAESMFKERVKGTAYAESFDAYLDAFSHRFQYFDQLSVWAEFFRDIHVLAYDDLVTRPNFVSAFFEALQVPLEHEAEPAPRLNTSLSNDLIAYKRDLNRRGLVDDALYEIAELMQTEAFLDGLPLDRRSTLWADPARRQVFMNGFAEQNAQVLERFATLDRSTLFPDPADGFAPPYAGLTAATARAIAERLDALGAPRAAS